VAITTETIGVSQLLEACVPAAPPKSTPMSTTLSLVSFSLIAGYVQKAELMNSRQCDSRCSAASPGTESSPGE